MGHFATLLGLLLLGSTASALAVRIDTGIAAQRLVITANAKGNRAVFVARDPAIDKGPEASSEDNPGLSASLEVYFADDSCALRGTWTLPAPWERNRGTTAIFKNASAPDGPSGVRAARIKSGKLARIQARSLGDRGAADPEAGEPGPGGLITVLTIRNTVDGSIRRFCSRFSEADGSSLKATNTTKRRRLVATKGVAVDCPTSVLATTPADADQCEVLNAAECLLPYPSSRFLVPADTATGFAVSLPQIGVPQPNGPEIPVEQFMTLDGFSPAVQVLMHFPQGVDPSRSDASRLLEPECCGQPAGPPWIDTRTHSDRSLDPDSPTILLDADTGERLLHFIENDARATDPARRTLFLRPGRMLTYGHRYIVAMRHLATSTCEPVVPEAAFAAIRDGEPGSAEVEARRAYLETEVLDVLESNGIAREDLVLAFDFRVGSEDANTKVMRSMRDQALAWVDTVANDENAVPFTVDSVITHDCDQPGQIIAKDIAGTFEVPLFLEGDLDDVSTPFANLDDEGMPVQNGFHSARFFATLPCSAFDNVPPTLVLFGHGLFQEGLFFTNFVPQVVNQVIPWQTVAVATDWRGLSTLDAAWVVNRIIGNGTSELHRFAALPARLRQGLLNTLVLARMTKLGIFNRHVEFEIAPDVGIFPGPTESIGYFGVSLGGIMGTYMAALSPDIDNYGLDVGAINFSCMLQRATPFAPFDALLAGIGIVDPMETALGIQLTHEFWVSGEPASVAHRVTSNPFPGSGNPKHVIHTAAWLDHQVSNTCTEIAARTMGLGMIEGSIQRGVAGIPDTTGPQSSGLIFGHIGEIDILNPDHASEVPPLANIRVETDACDPHPRHAAVPVNVEQVVNFLISGTITPNCDGLCDGGSVEEQTLLGACTP